MNDKNQSRDSESVVITKAYRGEVCEKKNVFNQSLFRRVYKRAYRILQEQVNLQVPQTAEQELEENTDNVIVFMGRRGTEKSSAMKSFMNSLLENHKIDDKSDEYRIQLTNSNKKVRFISVDSIDASLLEREEDIFEAILAKLFNQFLKDNENNNSIKYDSKELFNKFSSIYKKHLNIKQRNDSDVYSAEVAISNLRDLARSVDIKQEFGELIEQYIQVKSHSESEYNGYELYETFLVISIDDIDMNVQAGFEILEKIQRYLKVKRLIVLLAVNHEQMKLCCQKHFEDIISSKRGVNINNLNYYINELADQYMEKAIPSYSRVYLPSLKKMDYDKNNMVKILCRSKDKTAPYPIKEAMFFEAWQKTGVRYDTEGKKRHFLEPESLRELNNWRIYRSTMPELGTIDSKDFLEKLDFNHRRMMDDLLFRYADEVLQNVESKLFISLSELHIGRRGREIVSLFLSKNSKYDQEEKSLTQLRVDYKTFGYSYGELLRVLYCMGRTHIYDKKLVHAILAMYSLTLTKIFYRYKCKWNVNTTEKSDVNISEEWNIDLEKSRNVSHNYIMLKEIMNGSVGGSWSRKVTPILNKTIEHTIGQYFTGCSARNELKDSPLKISKSAEKQLKNLMIINEKGQKNSLTEKDAKKQASISIPKNAEEQVRILIPEDTEESFVLNKEKIKVFGDFLLQLQWEFMMLLFLSSKDWKLSIKEKKESDFNINDKNNKDDKNNNNIQEYTTKILLNLNKDEEDDDYSLYFDGIVEYNIMNFINNIFELDERLRDFIKKIILSVLGEKRLGNINEDIDNILKYILERNNQKENLYREMYEWYRKTGGMVVPVYSIDIYYNMFKRMVRRQKFSEIKTISLEDNELFKVLENIFDEIEEALEKNDGVYKELDDFSDDDKFAEIFNSCPFVRKIRNATNDEKKRYCDNIKEWIVMDNNKEDPLKEIEDLMFI